MGPPGAAGRANPFSRFEGRNVRPGGLGQPYYESGHFTTARERIGGRRWLHAAQSYFHDITPAVAQRVPVAWINRKSMQPTGAARADREFRTLTELADWLA